jgi:hypothetical protein
MELIMNIKWIATTALSVVFLLPAMQAQAGIHSGWHSQRLAHHQQEADYHLHRFEYHKAELHEENSWWHAKRAEHHWEEYQEHLEEIDEHHAELHEEEHEHHVHDAYCGH